MTSKFERFMAAALLKQMADEGTGVGRAEMAALRQEVAEMAGDLAEAMRTIPGYKQLIDGIGDMSRAELAAFRDRLDNFAEDVAEAMGRLPLNGDTGPMGPMGPPGRDAVGLPGRDGRDGMDGRDGAGITSARMDGDTLVLGLSDGTERRIGRVRGADGKDGPRGPAGPRGQIGVTVSNQAPSPSDGQDGDIWFQI
jgi:hypothetical protein